MTAETAYELIGTKDKRSRTYDLFNTKLEAETVAGIEGTQMEGIGVKFEVKERKLSPKLSCTVLKEMLADEELGVLKYSEYELKDLAEDEEMHASVIESLKRYLKCEG